MCLFKKKETSVEKIIIGHSDYSREQIDTGDCGKWQIGSTQEYMKHHLKKFEELGYTVTFEKKFFLTQIFSLGTYRIIGTKIKP